MSWNVNAPSFVPNVNARPFVPGQRYESEPVAPAQPPAPEQDWDAEEDQAAVAAPSEAAPAHVNEPAEPEEAVEPPQEKPEPQVDEPKAKESTPASDPADDIIAPIAKKFQRAVFVDDGSHKEHINIVFVGHVDAGKSTIGGQLMFLTGMVDKRTLEKYEREAKEKGRESWYLSWCMDTNDEEREKGKTVEVGRAYFETERRHFTILDAPGHKSFVPNMISGANQADLAVLVISARRGEFETGFDRGGQTREHAMLVKTAGVKHLVVLVNKMDDPTVKWEEERYKEIEGKLSPFLRKCGFNPKTDITYIPCSGLTGAFIKDRPSASDCSWYTGACFIEFIDQQLPSYKRDYNGPVRCIVVDKYSEMGTVVIGKMESGVVEKGDTLIVMPNKQPVQVLQAWNDELEGVEEAELNNGFVIASPDSLPKVGRLFDAEVFILEHKSIITSGYSCVMHIQSAIKEVVVKGVLCTIDKKTGQKTKSRFVRQDEKCIMRLESPESFVIEPFKDYPYLGRFTLRDEGKTIAIGKVLKVIE
ncbi:unnamed protein product [Caenorhabditis auriculariae]|uniref:Tr-type G domain-containing protein n=1 Tax=Caenorhabditis auriculariae TaxID=2777116 RepID=A0A8S1HL32_9PELO|nr:unnamed protein product [Caenorhabditis auriculariae]